MEQNRDSYHGTAAQSKAVILCNVSHVNVINDIFKLRMTCLWYTLHVYAMFYIKLNLMLLNHR